MKLPSGKRFGQSEHELALAVFFSFFLHAAVVFVALFLHFSVFPKTVIPPAYQVKLVGPPKELVTPTAAELPKKEEAPPAPKPLPAPKKEAVEVKKVAPKKDAMPDLGRPKQKLAPVEQTNAKEEEPRQSPSRPSVPAGGHPAAGIKSEGVAVNPSSGEFKFPSYLATIHFNIERNWNPPPGVKGIKAKVQFSILRSGLVVKNNISLIESSGNFYFDQAAIRAILMSSPFPQMPEDFSRPSLDLSVDLIKQE